jgi:hypothetical protein
VAATRAIAPPISASVQRVSAAPGSGSSVLTTIDCTAACVNEQLPTVEQERRRHRQRDDEASAATIRSRADARCRSADEHPDGHPRVTSTTRRSRCP